MTSEYLRVGGLCLLLFVGALFGTRAANAEKQNPCGSSSNDVCTYESNGCDSGEICVHLKCDASQVCPTGSADFTECWRCKTS